MVPCEPANETSSQEDRRDHFRIEEVLPVFLRPMEGPCPNGRVFSGQMVGLEESPEGEADDPGLSPGLRLRLDKIEAKLNLILERLYGVQDQPTLAQNCRVSLSASGIRLATRLPLAEGDTVEVRLMISEQDYTWLVLYGRVSRSVTPPESPREIAVCFSEMDLVVRETLIRYILQRQREQIRRRRDDND